MKFCANNPFVSNTLASLYDIVTKPDVDPHKSWKQKLAESLILSNKSLPQISNQCCYNSNLNAQETGQQTQITCFQHQKEEDNFLKKSLSSDLCKDCSSWNVTTSSCVSCSGFDSGTECMRQIYEHPLEAIVKARTVPLSLKESSSSFTKSLKEISTAECLIEEQEGDLDVNEDKFNSNENNIHTSKVLENLSDDNKNLEKQLSVPDKSAEVSTTAAVDIIGTTTGDNKLFDSESPQLSVKENKFIGPLTSTEE